MNNERSNQLKGIGAKLGELKAELKSIYEAESQELEKSTLPLMEQPGGYEDALKEILDNLKHVKDQISDVSAWWEDEGVGLQV